MSYKVSAVAKKIKRVIMDVLGEDDVDPPNHTETNSRGLVNLGRLFS